MDVAKEVKIGDVGITIHKNVIYLAQNASSLLVQEERLCHKAAKSKALKFLVLPVNYG